MNSIDRDYEMLHNWLTSWFGVRIRDVWTDVPRKSGRPTIDIVAPLLELARSLMEPIVRGAAICVLDSLPKGWNATMLAKFFDQERDEEVRWRVADVFYGTRPTGIQDWLRRKFEATERDESYGMLVLASARCLPPNEARDIAYREFSLFPLHCANALRYVGDVDTLHWISRVRPTIDPKLFNYGPIMSELKATEKSLASKLRKAGYDIEGP